MGINNLMSQIIEILSGYHGVTIRLQDKLRAFEFLANPLGMFRDEARIDLEGRDGSEILARLYTKLDTYSGR